MCVRNFGLSVFLGGSKFYDNIETMIGFRINPWFRICWTYITPCITMVRT